MERVRQAPVVLPVALLARLSLDDVTGVGIAVVDGRIEDPSAVVVFATCYLADDWESPGVRVAVAAPGDSTAGGVSDEEEVHGLGASAIYSEPGRFVRVVLDDGTIVTVEIAFFMDPEDPRDAPIERAEIAVAGRGVEREGVGSSTAPSGSARGFGVGRLA